MAFIWIANAILTARLATLSYRFWAVPIATCFAAGAIVTATIGLGPAMALPLSVINVAESAVGAALLRLFVGRRSVLESHRWLVAFVLATGVIAPLLSAVTAAGLIAFVLDDPFHGNAVRWFSGHALGTLAFMPIAMLILRSDARRMMRRMSWLKVIELTTLLAFVAIVTLVAFSQDKLPLLFLPMLPIVLATFRGGELSTAASILMLALIGGILTMQGHGPISLRSASTGSQMQFLQFYVACTMLTMLPANAELKRRGELFRRLRDSEARYRLVMANSTDIVLNVDTKGYVRFASESIHQIVGHRPEDLIGKQFSMLLHPDDSERAMAALRRTIEDVDGVTISEYRGRTETGEYRWYETQSRAVLDDHKTVTGVVSAIRDVTRRKANEERLARVALTDPLTGLTNRRGFDEELITRLHLGGGGCVALFDLDYFKQINDTYGHLVGDEVLRRFAALARSSVREQDIVARIGGEEFAVILPEATIEQARLVCDRLRRAIGDARMRIDGEVIAVTVSGGVAPYDALLSVEQLMRAADTALYTAKRAGRDQLAMAA